MDNAVQELLPADDQVPDALQNVYHYAQDEFVQAAIALKKEISNKLRGIPPEHRIIAKRYSQGVSGAQIARDLGKDERNTWRIIKSKKVAAVIDMLHHYELVLDGPMEMQRKNMLWRIAVRSEMKSPKVAVEALDKLNRMNHTYTPEGGGGVGTINIIINNANLPKGALD